MIYKKFKLYVYQELQTSLTLLHTWPLRPLAAFVCLTSTSKLIITD